MTDTAVIADLAKAIKQKLENYQAPDDSLLGMMPDETAEMIRFLPGTLGNAADAIVHTQQALEIAFQAAQVAERQTEILQKAIYKFATESGQGQIFLQNMQLCVDQIKSGA